MALRNGERSCNRPPERLVTPEHLDRALYVTTPKAWAALCALLAILIAVVVWSIVGEISTYVRAEGIILSRGGMVFDAVATRGGRVARIVPAVGDTVDAGDVVAETFDAETMERYNGALALVEERLQVLHERQTVANEENVLFEESVAEQRTRLESLRRTGEELVENARRRLMNLDGLAERGIVSQTTVEIGAQTLDNAQRSLFDVMRRQEQLEADELRRRTQLDAGIADTEAQVADARRRVNELAAVVETWQIRTTVSGRVTEIKTQVGATLSPGEPVLSIETGEEGLDVLIYVTPVDGKRVESGMPALVSPSTVRREEFGSMTGTVESLSEFPASLSGIVAVLQNQELATAFSNSGSPYPGRVVLTPDPSTVSGFTWTSARGATVDITPGTLAAVEIRVASQPPVTLALPWFRNLLGL